MVIHAPLEEFDGLGDGGNLVDEGAVRLVVSVGISSLAGYVDLDDVVARGRTVGREPGGLVFRPTAVYHITAQLCKPHHLGDIVWVIGVVVVEPPDIVAGSQIKPFGPFGMSPVVEIWLSVEGHPGMLLSDLFKVDVARQDDDFVRLSTLREDRGYRAFHPRCIRMSSHNCCERCQ